MRESTTTLLTRILPIVESYEERGYRLTVRQLYYQLVSRLIVPNTEASYQKVSKIVTMGRMHGMIDWDVIVDRVRVPMMPNEFGSMGSFVDAVKNSYRSYRWQDQDYYVEVMVEKEALAGILEPITRKYHVSLLVNKGYASASAMHEVAMRMQKQNFKDCRILYMGDHDPSGMDMVRDIESRLYTFGSDIEVERLALNMDQIEEHKLPPNPAKKSDPRSKTYHKMFGDESWELDALDPEVLSDILEIGIQKYMDIDAYNTVVKKELVERDALARVTKDL